MPDPVAASNLIVSRAGGEVSLSSVLGPSPQRGFLKNLNNQRMLAFQFNPVQLRESYEAEYARPSSMGLSHERMQFTGNKNAKIPLDLVFDDYVDKERAVSNPLAGRRPITGNAESIRTAAPNYPTSRRRYLLEMLYPRRAQRLSQAAPPQVLFVWPGMISMRVRVTKLDFSHLMFANKTPVTRILHARVTLEEDVDRRMYSEEQVTFGTQRPWATRTSTGNRSRRR